jgi:hypothetical protein
MKQTPPRWARKFLQCYCDDSLLEEIVEDLHELFRLRNNGPRQARLLYGWDVLRSIPLALLTRKSIQPNLPLEGRLSRQHRLLKQELTNLPGIAGVTLLSQAPTNIDNGVIQVDWAGKKPQEKTLFT